MLTMAPGSVRIRVAELLKERGMSVSDLAEEAGLAYGTALALSRSSNTRVDLDTLARVCAALSVQIADLLVYEAEEPQAI